MVVSRLTSATPAAISRQSSPAQPSAPESATFANRLASLVVCYLLLTGEALVSFVVHFRTSTEPIRSTYYGCISASEPYTYCTPYETNTPEGLCNVYSDIDAYFIESEFELQHALILADDIDTATLDALTYTPLTIYDTMSTNSNGLVNQTLDNLTTQETGTESKTEDQTQLTFNDDLPKRQQHNHNRGQKASRKQRQQTLVPGTATIAKRPNNRNARGRQRKKKKQNAALTTLQQLAQPHHHKHPLANNGGGRNATYGPDSTYLDRYKERYTNSGKDFTKSGTADARLKATMKGRRRQGNQSGQSNIKGNRKNQNGRNRRAPMTQDQMDKRRAKHEKENNDVDEYIAEFFDPKIIRVMSWLDRRSIWIFKDRPQVQLRFPRQCGQCDVGRWSV